MSSYTNTRSASVAATAARVEAVLLQVHLDFINAISAGLVTHEAACSWRSDLAYMLWHNALEHFEIRVERGGARWNSWRYEVSNDGSLRETSRGGGINFFAAPPGYTAIVVIKQRPGLSADVSAEIERRGWIYTVGALTGLPVRERAYSQDCWGVVRYQIAG